MTPHPRIYLCWERGEGKFVLTHKAVCQICRKAELLYRPEMKEQALRAKCPKCGAVDWEIAEYTENEAEE